MGRGLRALVGVGIALVGLSVSAPVALAQDKVVKVLGGSTRFSAPTPSSGWPPGTARIS
jgi:hypothetical protein